MAKTKELGLVGFIAFLVALFVVGIMIINAGNEQADSTSPEATSMTIGIGQGFVYAVLVGVLLLVAFGLGWLIKNK